MYQPVWSGVIEGYTKNQVFKNLWRFASVGYEYEDALHDGYIVYTDCAKGFNGKDAAQFMAYFKTALYNQFNDMGRLSIAERENLIDGCVSEKINLQGSCADQTVFIIKEASKEVRDVFELLFNMPFELLEELGFFKKKSRGVHNNKLLCELLGYDSKQYDLVDMVKSYLRNEV